jgi:cation transport ATPase
MLSIPLTNNEGPLLMPLASWDLFATGDLLVCVGDAALRAADCGIAMGNGSGVTRGAADMVLLEDFSAIVVVLEYGKSCALSS